MNMKIRLAIFALAVLGCTNCGRETAEKRVKETQPLRGPAATPNLRSETKALPPANAFLSILEDAKKQTQLPLLLPSELPASYSGLSATLSVEAGKYAINLLADADAGRYVAGFSAEKEEKYSAADIGNTKQVALAKNTIGFFRPISCGGSCSPVNLWWEQSGLLYNIQAVMSSDTSEDEQEKFIIPIADSAILGGPR
jgi:hypothetical protein